MTLGGNQVAGPERSQKKWMTKSKRTEEEGRGQGKRAEDSSWELNVTELMISP